MTSSRAKILAAIRRRLPQATPLPDLAGPWSTWPDRAAQFRDVLASVGGTCLPVADAAEADRALRQLAVWQAAKKTASIVPGVGTSTFDLDAVADPHDLEDVDVAVLPGEVAVAENGAVWVTDRGLKHRVLFFIPQHLALVVPAAGLVDTMHDAYERIAVGGPEFGCFISGPSKTADIEQSLVIGAHGPRSLTVLLTLA